MVQIRLIPPSQEGGHGGTAPTRGDKKLLKVPLLKGDLGGSPGN
jgi:hypothetical protein